MHQTLLGFFSKMPSILSKQRSNSVAFVLGFILLPVMENVVFEKSGRKKYALLSFLSHGFKVFLAFLTIIVGFHIRVTIIKIRVPYLERPI